MATDVPKLGDVLNSDEEDDDSHVGILHSTAIGDLSGSGLAHDFSVDEDQVCSFLLVYIQCRYSESRCDKLLNFRFTRIVTQRLHFYRTVGHVTILSA